LMEPDFWVKGAERYMLETELKPCSLLNNEVPEADLVTIFEESRLLQDVDFQSNVLGLYYDGGEVAKRLKSPGMSVICLKVRNQESYDCFVSNSRFASNWDTLVCARIITFQEKEFDITVKNSDSNYIICAVCIEIAPDKCPSSVALFGRKISLQTKTLRTFDVALTRRQSITCCQLSQCLLKKLVLLNEKCSFFFRCLNLPLQVFGKMRKDLGFLSSSYRFEQIITLPEQTIVSFFSTCCKLGMCLKSQPMEWLMPLAEQFASPGFVHGAVNRRALMLLKQLSPSLETYYQHKIFLLFQDKILFASLQMHQECGTLQLSLFNSIAAQLKQLLLQRVLSFRRNCGDIISFLKLLAHCVLSNGVAADAVLDCLLTIAFMYLAAGSSRSTEITELILELLFAEDIVIANRCRCVMAAIISNYSATCVKNHQSLFVLVEGAASAIAAEHKTSTASSTGHLLTTKFTPSIVGELETELQNLLVQAKSSSESEGFTRGIKHHNFCLLINYGLIMIG
uniref:DUF4704 domain-containing protein n=1 Tax=Gongylonema pulchrum TaxID=637853 RepID=A0A183EFM1_9BILA